MLNVFNNHYYIILFFYFHCVRLFVSVYLLTTTRITSSDTVNQKLFFFPFRLISSKHVELNSHSFLIPHLTLAELSTLASTSLPFNKNRIEIFTKTTTPEIQMSIS